MTVLHDNTGEEYVSIELDDKGEFMSGNRKDGLVDMPIDLPSNIWLELAFEAHKKDITLNEHLTNIIMAAVAAVNDEKEKADIIFDND